jgi:type VI secretion system protein ImpH
VAGNERTAVSSLIDRLLSRPETFELCQAISLLERAEPARRPVASGVGRDEPVSLRSTVSMAFAPSDVTQVAAAPPEDREAPPWVLSTPALALTGSQGPLPAVFSDWLLATARHGDRAGLDFLDIFQQRLIGFLYRSRRLHRPALGGAPLEESALGRSLDALSGLGMRTGNRGPDGQLPWLRHAGVQAAAPRSLASLLCVLGDRLGIGLRGRSMVGAWLPVHASEQAVLRTRGRPRQRLGMDTILGRRAWDQSAAIEIETPPLPAARFDALLPGGRLHREVAWAAASHLQVDVELRLRLAVDASTLQRAGLGPGGPALGRTAWLSVGTGPAAGLQGPCVRASVGTC